MKRRDFLKISSAASAPLFINGIPVFASPSTGNSLFDYLAQSSQSCGKVLVIIQQNGGNDGLNTIIPIDKYTNLQAARSNILVPEANILSLSGSSTTGIGSHSTDQCSEIAQCTVAKSLEIAVKYTSRIVVHISIRRLINGLEIDRNKMVPEPNHFFTDRMIAI